MKRTLSLSYPVRPHRVTRAWGVPDILYRAFGFERHNGIDIAVTEGQEVRAPMNGKVTLVGNQPKGSGIFLCLLSDEAYDFPDGKRAHVELTFMHLSETTAPEGARIREGDLIARGGNTGRSTGAHLHLAPKRVKRGIIGYRDFDKNDANNTFDPDTYWNGIYALPRD